jgi:putative sterol carrier protein
MEVQDVFNGMADKFQQYGLQNVHGVIQFHVTGRENGEWYAHCQGDHVVVHEGVHPAPDVTVQGDSKTVVGLAEGRINPAWAMMRRKMKVKGSPFLIGKLSVLLMGKKV